MSRPVVSSIARDSTWPSRYLEEIGRFPMKTFDVNRRVIRSDSFCIDASSG
jgi:hypothetical protein